jgi:shikimate kinase
MKSNKNLVLLGMMGSGKSTIGKLIAKKLNLDFIDIDYLIEEQTGITILELFKKKGEVYFRILEEKISIKALKSKNSVISLGGGGFINEKIRKEVLMNNISIWLNLDSRDLIKRIKNSKKRPLAFNLNDSELLDLINKRSKIYSKALFKINCKMLDKKKILKKISDLYKNDQIKN